MKPAFPFALLAALALAGAPALAAQTASGSISSASPPVAAAPAAAPAASAPVPAAAPEASVAPAPAATPEQQAALAGARPAPAAAPAPAIDPALAPTATGSLLTTIFSLILVLGLLVGLAWLLKRFGPKTITGGANVKLVGALSVGARERILVVEVGEQWIVVGASPGRMNALATLPRQEGAAGLDAQAGAALPGANFAEWFKQTIEKRNGK
ncbi:flagellar biosynthetic protein FliO [Pseudoduganella aquatica]|uniref:flagellar biosynthetic protein FliO n=1 Tax=Pseudoduganella aquatica TaxID=2660641 RepID=UPI001E48F926|nr:flagellar biosynthetic protein FliO [Pseudoduganella aquatica]